MGILLGVATALAWGSADFLARSASRKIGSVRATFLLHFWGFVALTALLLATHDWGHLFDASGWRPWFWGILAGAINTLAMLALYRAFEVGKLAVVAPISAGYPVLTVALSAFSGEVLSGPRWIGIAVTLAGVILVARGESAEPSNPAQAFVSGISWSLAAGVGFGVLFWVLGIRVIPMTGTLASVWLIRLTGAVIMLVVILTRGIRFFAADRRANLQGIGVGLLDTAAFALSNLGMQLEQVSVISVLGSLYGAVTVGLAALFLRERLNRLQWCGIALIFAGIVLISR